jgi:hypothetical protein
LNVHFAKSSLALHWHLSPDGGRITLVLYRSAPLTRSVGREAEHWGARSIKLSEGSRSRVGGRGLLWECNRFLPEKPCQTGIVAKRLLLMLIDVGRLATMRHPTAGAIRDSKGQFGGWCLYTCQRPPREQLRCDGKPEGTELPPVLPTTQELARRYTSWRWPRPVSGIGCVESETEGRGPGISPV